MNQETVTPQEKDETKTPATTVTPAVKAVKPVTAKPRATKAKTPLADSSTAKAASEKPAPKKKAVATQAARKNMAEKSVPPLKAPAKSGKKAAPAEIAAAAKPEKAQKVKKHPPQKPRLVRDSFTLPENDYALFTTLKQRALASGIEVKKSEILRAAVMTLSGLDDAAFLKAIKLVERIKTGRPKK